MQTPRRLTKDLEEMTGVTLGRYWTISWKYTSPLALGIILCSSVWQLITTKLQYSAWSHVTATKSPVAYESWAVFVIVMLLIASSLCIPVVAVLYKLGYFKPEQFGIKQTEGVNTAVTESTFPLTEKV